MAATARQRKQAASRAGRRFLLIGALTVAALAGPSVASAASCLGSAGSTTLTLTLGSGEAARVFVQGALIGGASRLVGAGTALARAVQTGVLRGYALLLLAGGTALALYFLIVSG